MEFAARGGIIACRVRDFVSVQGWGDGVEEKGFGEREHLGGFANRVKVWTLTLGSTRPVNVVALLTQCAQLMRFVVPWSPYQKNGGLINSFFWLWDFCTSVLLPSYYCTSSVLLYSTRPQT